MITSKRIIRFMEPVESMSGKFAPTSKKAGEGQKLYVGSHRRRSGLNTFSCHTKKFAYTTSDAQAAAEAHQRKFTRVVTATRARMVNPEQMDADQIAFRNQTKYSTMFGFLFHLEWAKDNG